MISAEDLEGLEKMRREDEAIRKSAEHAKDATGDYSTEPEPEDEEIVRAVKRIREELNREWYGDT
jgi:hypothetical protein